MTVLEKVHYVNVQLNFEEIQTLRRALIMARGHIEESLCKLPAEDTKSTTAAKESIEKFTAMDRELQKAF